MEIQSSFTAGYLASGPDFVAAVATALCLLLSCLLLAVVASKSKKPAKQSVSLKACDCACSCGSSALNSDSAPMAVGATYVNGGGAAEVALAAERQSGASMMEQLVPEITTHALSYLDYPSLCRLSMTNSLMRRAANDDNAWKALYHKDFTLEQDSITPVNGWKAYYAATRAIVNINSEFFNIIRERSLQSMSRLWFSADYVKCVHASGELFSGYEFLSLSSESQQLPRFCLMLGLWSLSAGMYSLDMKVGCLSLAVNIACIFGDVEIER